MIKNIEYDKKTMEYILTFLLGICPQKLVTYRKKNNANVLFWLIVLAEGQVQQQKRKSSVIN